MADKVGLGSQYGAAAESTVGTYATPTRFLPFTTVEANLDQTTYDSKGLQPGQYGQQATLTALTTRSGTFSVSREVLSKGEGVFLNTLHGATVTPTTTTSPALAQAHPIGTTLPNGRSLTQQYLAAGTDATQNVVTGLGCAPTSMKFSAEKGGVLTTEHSYFATDVSYAQTLATATYASAPALFPFDKITVLLAGSQMASPTMFDTTITLPRATDRFFLNGTATAAEALVNDYVTVEGTIGAEFTDVAQLNAVLSSATRTLKITCLGRSTIATGRYPKFELDFAAVQTLPHSVSVGGPGIISATIPFRALLSSTNPLVTINTESLDATL